MKNQYEDIRVGQEKYNTYGELMKCVQYNNAKSIIVEFQDKYKGIKHTSWKNFNNGNVKNPYYLREKREGCEKYNNKGELMKIVQYNNSNNVIVEFQDSFKKTIETDWECFEKGRVRNPIDKERLYKTVYNKQGYIMKCIVYNRNDDIVVEFQDEFKATCNTNWNHFIKGKVKNPFAKTVQGVGIIGIKYPTTINYISLKEYKVWSSMLKRCFNLKTKEKHPTYKDVTCCKEWLYYPNFYEWLHSQENFEKWLNSDRWAVDKDILVKGNKIYSPETCCLVPPNVNNLFIKQNVCRGDLPIGVKHTKNKNGYMATIIYGKCNNNQKTTAYSYPTPEEAFYLGYKPTKEAYIKRVAQEEYELGNITKTCYEAMMNYQVEITD